MNSTSVLKRKLRQSVKKAKHFKEKSKVLALENKRLRRNAKERSERCVPLRRENERLQAENEELRSKLAIYEGKASGHHYSTKLVGLCIFLRVFASVSLRSIPKILSLFNSCFELGLRKIPCANTVQNWTAKLGYFELSKPLDASSSYTLIVDEHAGLCNQKLLLALAVDSQKAGRGPLNFSDVCVSYLDFSKSWTAERIAEKFQKTFFDKSIKIEYMLSDEGSNLKKAAQLLALPHFADISHAVGTCLKKVYEKDPDYQNFIQLVRSYQSKGVNQDLSYLMPPKQRAKARFMNQKPVVEWAKKTLENYEQLKEKEQKFFGKLKAHKPIIESLDKATNIGKNISLKLKNQGFNKQNYLVLKQDIQKQNTEDNRLKKFLKHLEQYLDDYKGNLEKLQENIQNQKKEENIQNITQKSYHVCSDIIESIFGKYKNMETDNPWLTVSAMCLELPIHTLSQDQIMDKINQALEQVLLSNIDTWKQQYKADNQMVKRNKFYQNNKS